MSIALPGSTHTLVIGAGQAGLIMSRLLRNVGRDHVVLDVPVHERGITGMPGLSFIGMLWQRDNASANLAGVARDAEYLASRWEGV